MQAARFYQPGDLRVETVPDPEPGPGEIVIGIHTALTCGTDLKCYRRGHPVLLGTLPSLFGHEGAGHIIALGEGVRGFSIGDPVVAANSAPCGTCFYCHKQQENLCEHLDLLNGTYAQQLLVPAPIVSRNTHKLPSDFPLERAAFAEPLAIALRGAKLTGIQPGEHIAVLGLGAIGLLVTRVASWMGANVTALGRSPMKLALAKTFGQAQTVLDVSEVDLNDPAERTGFLQAYTPGGRGFDRVIEVVGQPQTWEQALGLVRRGGTVNCFGGCPPGTTVALDTRRLHYEEITLLSLFHHTPIFFRQAVELLVSGAVDPSELIGARYPLAQVVDALEAVSAGQVIKIALDPKL